MPGLGKIRSVPFSPECKRNMRVHNARMLMRFRITTKHQHDVQPSGPMLLPAVGMLITLPTGPSLADPPQATAVRPATALAPLRLPPVHTLEAEARNPANPYPLPRELLGP